MNLEEKLVRELQNNEQVIHILPIDDLAKELEAKQTDGHFGEGVWSPATQRDSFSQTEWQQRKEYIKSGANLVAPMRDVKTATMLLKEFGLMPEKVMMRHYGGKSYVIFKGYAGQRRVIKGTRYLATNPKIVRMAIGPKGIINSVKGGAAITVVLSAGIEIFDYFIRDEATLSHLLGTVTGDLITIGLSAIAGAVAGLLVGGTVLLGSAAAAPLIAAIGIGLLAGHILGKIDSKYKVTEALIEGYKQLGIKLSKLEAKIVPPELEREINKNPEILFCVFGPCDAGYE